MVFGSLLYRSTGFQYDGTIWGSLAISMPESRYTRMDPHVIPYIQTQAGLMSEYLGYHQAQEG
jgi:hypothetical protein